MQNDELCEIFAPRLRRGRLQTWIVRPGDRLIVDQVIGKMTSANQGAAITDIYSPYDGIVKELKLEADDEIHPDVAIAIISVCRHLTDYKGLCTACGADVTVSRSNGGAPRATMKVFGKQSLNVTKEGLALIKKKLADDLRRNHKLLLVLDLDHTVVHASVDTRAKSCVDNVTAIDFELNGRTHYVKLRPGVHSFLQGLHPFFDIQVFTWGTREYAEKIVAALDPDGQIIKSRITARDDIDEASGGNHKVPPQKQLERLIPVCESMALILDDSACVWRDLLPNLIEIRKFVYFPVASEYAHGQAQASPSSVFFNDGFDKETLRRNERDNVLPSLQKLLTRLHREYYSAAETADVRDLLRDARISILSDVEIVFTGVVPLGTKLLSSKEARIAHSLGAVVTADLTPSTSHLIGISRQKTSKWKEAEERLQSDDCRLRYIVHLDWLLACATHFVRIKEDDFNLESYTTGDGSRVSYLDVNSIKESTTTKASSEVRFPARETDLLSRKRTRSEPAADAELEDHCETADADLEDHCESDFERDFEAFLSQPADAL